MTLTLATKYILVLSFLIFSFSAWSQSKTPSEKQNEEVSKNSKSITDYGVKGSFGATYNILNPAGNKYIGLAYKGKGGYAIRFKLFVYDGIFLGASTGFAAFENLKPELTGNYDKTRLGSHYIFLGYEYRPLEKLALSLNTSLFGEARFKNEYRGGNEAFQIDKASIRALEFNIDYFLAKELSINLSYTYRNDKTKIKTSPNLQSRFDRAQFSIISLGLNFQFGKDAIISKTKK